MRHSLRGENIAHRQPNTQTRMWTHSSFLLRILGLPQLLPETDLFVHGASHTATAGTHTTQSTQARILHTCCIPRMREREQIGGRLNVRT